MYRALPLLAALLVSACTPRYPVRTDFDPQIDFAAYRSYAFPVAPKPDTPDLLDNGLVHRRLEALFADQFDARGLTRQVDPANADLVIRYWITTKDRTDVIAPPWASPFYASYPYPNPYYAGRWASMYQDVIVRHRVEGTLVLDLIDRRSGALVWRSYAVGTLRGDLDRDLAALEAALIRALAEFPPAR